MTRLTTLDLPNFHRATIGFDRLFDELERGFQNSPNGNGYPPYNIAQINENEFMISLAVAGFGMDNLEITKDGDQLKLITYTKVLADVTSVESSHLLNM